VIENGTRANEIKVFGTLAELPQLIERAGIKGPAMLIIGEVSALANDAQKLARMVSDVEPFGRAIESGVPRPSTSLRMRDLANTAVEESVA